MLCARCVLCDYCFKIKTTADNIIDIACANDRLRI